MDKQLLREMLHAERLQAEAVDADERELLKSLKADVQAILERTEAPTAPPSDSLGDELREAVRQFEMAHPTLTWATGEVLEILSRAGV